MPKLFGLDIGTTSVKAVEVVPFKKELRLLAANSLPTPPKGMVSESEIDQQVMAGTIKRLVEMAKIDTKLTNVALPENQVFTRVIEMPILSDKELTSAIKWESEQYIPLPEASVSLDWEVLRIEKEKNMMEVLLVGAPTNLIARYQKVLTMAGLNAVYMETELLAAARSLVSFSEIHPAAIIINIGANTTDLGVFKEGKLVVGYTVPTGSAALTRAIAQEFGFDTNQAEQYKKTYGLNEGALEGKIAVIVKPILESIASEVKKAISFFQNKNFVDGEIKRIILAGGGAKLPELPVFFANSLGIETELANPWRRLVVDRNLFKVQLNEMSLYSVATGLALREYGR